MAMKSFLSKAQDMFLRVRQESLQFFRLSTPTSQDSTVSIGHPWPNVGHKFPSRLGGCQVILRFPGWFLVMIRCYLPPDWTADMRILHNLVTSSHMFAKSNTGSVGRSSTMLVATAFFVQSVWQNHKLDHVPKVVWSFRSNLGKVQWCLILTGFPFGKAIWNSAKHLWHLGSFLKSQPFERRAFPCSGAWYASPSLPNSLPEHWKPQNIMTRSHHVFMFWMDRMQQCFATCRPDWSWRASQMANYGPLHQG